MKRIIFGAIALLMMCTACNDFRLQTDYKYVSSPLDPHIGINAWEFMQTRDDLSEMV